MVKIMLFIHAHGCHTISLPTRDGQLCVVCMLMCTVPSFAVLPGVLIFSYGEVNCLNS